MLNSKMPPIAGAAKLQETNKTDNCTNGIKRRDSLQVIPDRFQDSIDSTFSLFDASPGNAHPSQDSIDSINSTAVSEKWPELTLIGDGLPDLPSTSLPKWASDHASEYAKFAKVPTGLIVLQDLATIAACVQGKFDITPGNGMDKYDEPSLAIWTCGVANVGGNKSGVVRAAREPVEEWERIKRSELKSDKEEKDRTRRVIDAVIKRLEEQAAKTDDSHARNSLLDDAKNQELQKPLEVHLPEVWLTNITDEALQSCFATQHGTASILADEGGVFDVMAGMYSDGVNADTFLCGHAGASIKVKRQGRVCDVAKPALSIGLVVQPGILDDLVKNPAKKKLFDKGLFARFFYFFPAPYVGGRDVKDIYTPKEDVMRTYNEKIQELLSIEVPLGINGQRDPVRLYLSSSAFAVWSDFWQYVESNQGEGSSFEDITDWTSKLHGACLRIAGLIHVAERKPGREVSVECVNKAVTLCKALIPHTVKAFELMRGKRKKYKVTPAQKDALKVLEWIREQGSLTFEKTLLTKDNKFKNWTDRREDALSLLTAGGYISKVKQRVSKGPRPIFYYEVNPVVLGGVEC
ncbi:MAG TPA: YfjI family protein [Oculatellaceae cyanobacterium]